MSVELTIDRTKELPKGTIFALEKVLLKRLGNQYENCRLSVRRAGAHDLSVFGGDRDDKKKNKSILQDIRESSDEWFVS